MSEMKMKTTLHNKTMMTRFNKLFKNKTKMTYLAIYAVIS